MGRGREGPRQTGGRARCEGRPTTNFNHLVPILYTSSSDRTACAGRARGLKCAIGEMRASELEEREEKNLLLEALSGRG